MRQDWNEGRHIKREQPRAVLGSCIFVPSCFCRLSSKRQRSLRKAIDFGLLLYKLLKAFGGVQDIAVTRNSSSPLKY